MKDNHVFFGTFEGFEVDFVGAFNFGVFCGVREAFFLDSGNVENVDLGDYGFEVWRFQLLGILFLIVWKTSLRIRRLSGETRNNSTL